MYSLYNIKYMKIPELIDLINEFVFGKDLATEEKLNEKQKKSNASAGFKIPAAKILFQFRTIDNHLVYLLFLL